MALGQPRWLCAHPAPAAVGRSRLYVVIERIEDAIPASTPSSSRATTTRARTPRRRRTPSCRASRSARSRRADGDEGSLRLQAAGDVRLVRALKDLGDRRLCVFASAWSATAATPDRQDDTVRHRTAVRHGREPGGSSGWSAAAVADARLLSPRGTHGGSIPHPGRLDGRCSSGLVRPRAHGDGARRLRRHQPLHVYEGPRRAPSRTLRSCSTRSLRDPYVLDEEIDLPPRHASIQGHAHRVHARLRRLPGRSAHREVIAEAVGAFKEAGATVEELALGIQARPA